MDYSLLNNLPSPDFTQSVPKIPQNALPHLNSGKTIASNMNSNYGGLNNSNYNNRTPSTPYGNTQNSIKPPHQDFQNGVQYSVPKTSSFSTSFQTNESTTGSGGKTSSYPQYFNATQSYQQQQQVQKQQQQQTPRFTPSTQYNNSYNTHTNAPYTNNSSTPTWGVSATPASFSQGNPFSQKPINNSEVVQRSFTTSSMYNNNQRPPPPLQQQQQIRPQSGDFRQNSTSDNSLLPPSPSPAMQHQNQYNNYVSPAQSHIPYKSMQQSRQSQYYPPPKGHDNFAPPYNYNNNNNDIYFGNDAVTEDDYYEPDPSSSSLQQAPYGNHYNNNSSNHYYGNNNSGSGYSGSYENGYTFDDGNGYNVTAPPTPVQPPTSVLKSPFFLKHKYLILGIILIIGFTIAGFFLYQWYMKRKHKILGNKESDKKLPPVDLPFNSENDPSSLDAVHFSEEFKPYEGTAPRSGNAKMSASSSMLYTGTGTSPQAINYDQKQLLDEIKELKENQRKKDDQIRHLYFSQQETLQKFNELKSGQQSDYEDDARQEEDFQQHDSDNDTADPPNLYQPLQRNSHHHHQFRTENLNKNTNNHTTSPTTINNGNNNNNQQTTYSSSSSRPPAKELDFPDELTNTSRN